MFLHDYGRDMYGEEEFKTPILKVEFTHAQEMHITQYRIDWLDSNFHAKSYLLE